MIEVANVTRKYGANIVVDDVTLSLPRSGITSIIGTNGAGKSTLLSMIARLMPMDAGRITVDGLDILSTPSDELARRLSILRQNNHIEARLTVRELVRFGRFPYSKGRLTPEDLEQVERAIVCLDLTDYAERFLDELSGGQRQRAFVAMIMSQDTDYVLFDEPLNNLDVRHSVDMMKLLELAARQMGKTVVVVLHDINFASYYSDWIIAMKQGRIQAQGTPDEIIRPTVLQSIFDAVFEVHHIGAKRIVTYYE